MKLGILTFHRAHNYGAVLQAYGLQEYLTSLGHDVYVIDYKPAYISDSYPRDGKAYWLSTKPIASLKGLYNYFVHSDIRHARWDGFEKFINVHLNLYPYQDGMSLEEFDAVFIGSDQVWSPAHTGGKYDPLLFGEGLKCKIIPYAPSCTNMYLTEKDLEFFREHLATMAAVSVREPKMKEILQPLTKKQISVVVDPSLLAGKDCFEKIAVTKDTNPYILTYEINEHSEIFSMAKGLAKKYNIDIVELTNGMVFHHRKTMHEEATPEEFLGYIKNAKCVITTSFHGTAFSLLFHTPFFTVLQNNNADGRMVALLNKIGMNDRLINLNDKIGDINFCRKYDLKELIVKSKEFINEALAN